MGIFSLDWFKSQKQKDLETLKVREQELTNKILEAQLGTYENPKVDYPSLAVAPKPIVEDKKIYRKIKLVNDVLTIVLNDGSVLSKPNATQEDFKKARNAASEQELFSLASSSEGIEEKKQQEAKIAEVQVIIDGVEILKTHPDFIVKEDSVYMKGVKRSIPELLVKRFAKIVSEGQNVQSEEYQALKKFWLKCCLNPNAQSAEDLYGFLENHHFKIDKNGNFYAYRRVKKVGDTNKELVEFISNTYNKIKGVWKKKPAGYEVIKGIEGYVFEKTKETSSAYSGEWIGNLQDLYENLSKVEENRYTSAHTGKEDYRVGEVISMPRNEGDDDNSVSCSYGFHAASKKYDYSGYGETPILMIINPMDVLAVPKGEVGKLRTCRWFFAMTLPENEKYILDDPSFDVTDLGDVFEEKCMTNLQEYVQNGFAEEVKRHTFTLPSITGGEVVKIVTSLEDMKKAISNRVVGVNEEEE